MRNRTTNESKPVGLFPFLAVLLCTMGALLVLLVVLAQHAGKHVAAQRAQPPRVAAIQDTTAIQDNEPAPAVTLLQEEQSRDTDLDNDLNDEAKKLRDQLAKILAYQEKLSQLKKEADERLDQEQERLSHLEEHARRIEHELARLAIAIEQLEATEKNQTVDQQQAESELAHLQELIKETQEQLEKLREDAETGQRSYAIIPYKGPNGTFRQPIYIECSKEGVTIQPEGIQFESSDFVAPGWTGNPLAAALRASREYLNAQAVQNGKPEPPDPYPLLIVRPDGIAQYRVARRALAAWDADFGYEFVDSDWNLEYPDMPDPRLAQIQHHAQLTARDQLARLIRSAPSRFRGVGLGGSSSMASGGNSGSQGYGAGGQSSEANEFGGIAQSPNGTSNGGGSATFGDAEADTENPTGEYQHGAFAGDSRGEGSNSQNHLSDSDSSMTFSEIAMSADSSATSSTQGSGGSLTEEGSLNSGSQNEAGTLAQAAGQSIGGGSPGGSSSSGSPSGASGGSPQAGQASASPSITMSNSNIASIAESEGKNWAVSQKSRSALPIQRPIQVVVRKDRIALLPSRHAKEGIEATGTVISLNQSTKQVSDDFVEALKSRVDQWGLAGNGLYWRPVLNLQIGPEAEGTARGLAKLLLHSGVEVQRSDTTTGSSNQALRGELDRATR